VEEIQENRSEQRQSKICLGNGEGRRSTNDIEKNDGWIRDEIWTREPSPEIVKRLIEWFSDDRN
jgi:hypothetical protein